MVKCITLEYPDGSIAIRGGIGPQMLARFNGDVDAARLYIFEEKVPIQNPDAVARLEDIELPSNETFRGAWVRGAEKIEVDMTKAREIHIERIVLAEIEMAKLLKLEEHREQLRGNIELANKHKARLNALNVLDLGILFIQIRDASNPEELSQAWPPEL